MSGMLENNNVNQQEARFGRGYDILHKRCLHDFKMFPDFATPWELWAHGPLRLWAGVRSCLVWSAPLGGEHRVRE